MSTTSKYITNNNNSTTIVQMSTFDNNNNNNKVEADEIETLHIDDDNKTLPILNDKTEKYIYDLYNSDVVRPEEVFSPLVTSINKRILGMRFFGGGNWKSEQEDNDNNKRNMHQQKAVNSYKYLGLHCFYWIMFTITLFPFLYLIGLDIGIAVFIATLVMGPMILTTPFAELHIFRSKFLSLRLKDQNDSVVKSLKKNFGCSDLWLRFMELSVTTITCVLPWQLLVVPYVKMYPGEYFLEIISIISIFVNVIALFIGIGFQKWQPLVVLHQKEILVAIKHTTTCIEEILYDEKENPRRSQIKLTYLSKKLIEPIQWELKKVWGAETTYIFVGVIINTGLSVFIAIGHMTPRMESAALLYVRIGVVVLLATMFPFMGVGLLTDSAKPYEIWHKMEKKLRQHADKTCKAVNKFDGNYTSLNEWLQQNRIALYLFGHAIDHDLPAKVGGAFASTLGAFAILYARMTGSV